MSALVLSCLFSDSLAIRCSEQAPDMLPQLGKSAWVVSSQDVFGARPGAASSCFHIRTTLTGRCFVGGYIGLRRRCRQMLRTVMRGAGAQGQLRSAVAACSAGCAGRLLAVQSRVTQSDGSATVLGAACTATVAVWRDAEGV